MPSPYIALMSVTCTCEVAICGRPFCLGSVGSIGSPDLIAMLSSPTLILRFESVTYVDPMISTPSVFGEPGGALTVTPDSVMLLLKRNAWFHMGEFCSVTPLIVTWSH